MCFCKEILILLKSISHLEARRKKDMSMVMVAQWSLIHQSYVANIQVHELLPFYSSLI
jgi:hypothetical protein